MTNEDIKWLKDVFPTYIKPVLRGGDRVNAYLKAEMLLNGWDKVNKRNCSCQLNSLKRSVEQSYNNWIQNENTLPE